MNNDIKLLETLEGLAAVLQDGSRKRVKQELHAAAVMLDDKCSEEELAALAIIVRETRRGNEIVTLRHLRASAKQEYRMNVRWDVVLETLAQQELAAVLSVDGDTPASGSQLQSILQERSSAEVRVGLRLRDPSFDPAHMDAGYSSNRQYLGDCFEYLARYGDILDTHRGQRQRMRRDNAETDDNLEERYALLRRRGAQSEPLPPLEQLAQHLELNRFEWTVLLLMLFAEIEGDSVEVRNLLGLAGDDILERYEMRQYFENDGTLIAHGILELHGDHPPLQLDVSLNDEIIRWLLHGGDTPEIAGGGNADEPDSFRNNEEYITGWLNVVRVLIGDSDNLPSRFRRRRRKSGISVPACEHPAYAAFAQRVDRSEACFPFDQLARDAGLDTNERIILAIGVYMALQDGAFDVSNATALLAGEKLLDRYRMQRYFTSEAPLLREGLLEIDDGFMGSADFTVPQAVLHRIIEDKSVTGENTAGGADKEFFERRTPRHTLADAVLPLAIMDDLGDALGSLSGELRSLLRDWGVERITAGRGHGSLLMLFSGPAGTGKTFTAEAFAGALGREMLITDAGKLLSKWYGGSEHNMQQMFRSYARLAKHADKVPLLLLNECDQLLMQRSSGSGRSTDRTEHRLQNILLEEFERFPGVLIATTNLVETLDEAFSRRFDYKIVFPAPDADARLALWRAHIPESVPCAEDLDLHDLARRFPFTGGQIAVAAANAIRSAARRGDRLEQADLQHACRLEKQGSFDHPKSGNGTVGFRPSALSQNLEQGIDRTDKEIS